MCKILSIDECAKFFPFWMSKFLSILNVKSFFHSIHIQVMPISLNFTMWMSMCKILSIYLMTLIRSGAMSMSMWKTFVIKFWNSFLLSSATFKIHDTMKINTWSHCWIWEEWGWFWRWWWFHLKLGQGTLILYSFK